MIVEKMLELILLHNILADMDDIPVYATYIGENFDFNKLKTRYDELGKEFLQPYALNNTEKSD